MKIICGLNEVPNKKVLTAHCLKDWFWARFGHSFWLKGLSPPPCLQDEMAPWQGYPNIGVDDRNQFDMLDSLPGGIDGLRQMVNDFQNLGVRVLLPYLPWDQGTRNSGQSDVVSMVDYIVRSDSDGMTNQWIYYISFQKWFPSTRSKGPIRNMIF